MPPSSESLSFCCESSSFWCESSLSSLLTSCYSSSTFWDFWLRFSWRADISFSFSSLTFLISRYLVISALVFNSSTITCRLASLSLWSASVYCYIRLGNSLSGQLISALRASSFAICAILISCWVFRVNVTSLRKSPDNLSCLLDCFLWHRIVSAL